jgi:hypothetical protein
VPPQKINIGVAFYGKALANCTQLYGSHTGYDGSTFWEEEGQPLYYNIEKRMGQFTRYWDDQVKCPYLLGNSINTFVTYDDAESIGYKAQYVQDHNAKGVIIWEITGDYLETSPGSGIIASTPLLDTLHAVFNEITSAEAQVEPAFRIYPNPSSGMVNIIASEPVLKVSVLSIDGILRTCYDQQAVIDAGQLERGVYFLHIQTASGRHFQKLVKK